MEQSQTFAMRDILHAAAAQEEEEFAPVRLSEPEDNFAVSIVDLALLAVQDETTADLDRSIWDTVTRGVKTAVRVIHNVERVESLADHFAMEDRLEAKTDAHAGELVERAKAHLEHVVTDSNRARESERNPAYLEDGWDILYSTIASSPAGGQQQAARNSKQPEIMSL